MALDKRNHSNRVPVFETGKEAEETPHVQRFSRPPMKVGITHGDTNGVGYEIILKAFADAPMYDLCTPVVYGSLKIALAHAKALDMKVQFNVVASANEALPGKMNLIECVQGDVPLEWGKVSAEAGHAAYVALERAAEDLNAGQIEALVTAPICKEAMKLSGFKYAGHTEYLASVSAEGQNEPLMILQNEMMRVALATVHEPLQKVAGQLTQEKVETRLRALYQSLRHDFLFSSPRIAVLALNPHSGDGGALGAEEQEIISPAIQTLVNEGIPCFGPYSADGFFGAAMYTHFDGILAMYHDQGLIPLKALGMDSGVNVTAGLSFVRTSPDHGTAFDIAGQGKADPASMRSAIYAAMDIKRNREADDEAKQNPLPKLYHERREDSERSRHTLPQEKAE
jgi:4-hydroxythreonine-4-phosphate dehydrogenase